MPLQCSYSIGWVTRILTGSMKTLTCSSLPLRQEISMIFLFYLVILKAQWSKWTAVNRPSVLPVKLARCLALKDISLIKRSTSQSISL